MTPEEVFDMSAGQIRNRMEWAAEIFYDLTSQYFPEIISPAYDLIINEALPQPPSKPKI